MEDERKVRQLEKQLLQKRDILQTLDDEIVNLISENDEDGTGCIQETSESVAFKENIDLALLTLEDRLSHGESATIRSGISRQNSRESVYSHGSQESASPSTSRRVRAKLPKLELKKFTGHPQDWQEFWDSYQSAIHDND